MRLNMKTIQDKINKQETELPDVDGKPLEEALDQPNITVIVEGNCNKLEACGDVEIKGDCGYVDCSGSCHIEGNVTGDVDASGSVTCGDVGGDIDASGSIRCTRR